MSRAELSIAIRPEPRRAVHRPSASGCRRQPRRAACLFDFGRAAPAGLQSEAPAGLRGSCRRCKLAGTKERALQPRAA